MSKFSEYGLPSFVTKVLEEDLKYENLSQIQQLIIQHIKSYPDSTPNIIAKSKNGSGKSLALCLLLLDTLGLLKQSDDDYAEPEPANTESNGFQVAQIEGVVLAPTREIAIQLHEYYNLLVKDSPKSK